MVFLIIMKINNLYNEKDNTDTRDSIMHKANGELVYETYELLNEHLMKVYINEREAMSLVCTGTNLVELVIGRIISEGIVHSIDEIDNIYICEYGLRAKIFIKSDISDKFKENEEITSCCQDNRTYLKGKYKLEKIKNVLKITDNDIFNIAEAFNEDSKIHRITSGTHAAYLYMDNKIVKSFEDIGRHNALDKIIGYIYMNRIISEKCIVFTTGRVPVDMARKAIYSKLGCLVSKAVPTSDAVDLAKEYNLNLICRAWRDSYQVFNEAK